MPASCNMHNLCKHMKALYKLVCPHCLQAVCILKQQPADWDTAKRMLGDPGFMRSLLDFDKDNIPPAVIRKLKTYIDNPQFTPEAVAKQSKAAQSLCMWARAMDVYNRVAKVMHMHRKSA